jgi:hypothetical protein
MDPVGTSKGLCHEGLGRDREQDREADEQEKIAQETATRARRRPGRADGPRRDRAGARHRAALLSGGGGAIPSWPDIRDRRDEVAPASALASRAAP